MPKTGQICCALAKRLGPERLAKLDAELKRPNHRSFRKLAAELDERHNAVERHKKSCLRLSEPIGGKTTQTIKVPETEDLPPLRERPKSVPRKNVGKDGLSHEVSQVSHGTGDGTVGVPDGTDAESGTDRGEGPRAPAPTAGKAAEVRRNRVLQIASAMADGTWDTPRDNTARRAAEWGLSRKAVAELVKAAADVAAVDPDSVQHRRVVALGRWGWLVEQARAAIEKGPEFPDTESKLLAAFAQAQTGWDKAAGVLDESTKVQINVVASPVFQALLDSILLSVAPYPEARAAVMAALRAKLDVLRQPVPAQLSSGDVIETTGEAA